MGYAHFQEAVFEAVQFFCIRPLLLYHSSYAINLVGSLYCYVRELQRRSSVDSYAYDHPFSPQAFKSCTLSIYDCSRFI